MISFPPKRHCMIISKQMAMGISRHLMTFSGSVDKICENGILHFLRLSYTKQETVISPIIIRQAPGAPQMPSFWYQTNTHEEFHFTFPLSAVQRAHMWLCAWDHFWNSVRSHFDLFKTDLFIFHFFHDVILVWNTLQIQPLKLRHLMCKKDICHFRNVSSWAHGKLIKHWDF